MNNKNVIVGLILFLGVVLTIGYFRNKTLKNKGVQSICKVIEIKDIGEGAEALDSKAAYFSYQVDGKEYISYDSFYLGTFVGSCYEIIYLPSNPKRVKVNFEKEVDCLNYSNY